MTDRDNMRKLRIGLKIDSFNGGVLDEEELGLLSMAELLELKKSVSDYLKLIESVAPKSWNSTTDG